MTDTIRTRAAVDVALPDEDLIAAEVEKGQQLAGHFPDAEALERGRRVYRGDLTLEEAHAELAAKYAQE